MSEYTDRLYSLVVDNIDDIVYDHLNKFKYKTVELHEDESDTDDGCVFGLYKLFVDNGKYVITIKASARFEGEQDCYDWSRESHYTKSVGYDDLEDYEHEIVSVVETDINIDKVIANDIEYSKENN
jgi:hypothetical protein